MVQVFQAEWCPYSHLVREKLTELGVDFIARQVEPNPEQRTKLQEVSGQNSIPAVVLDDGQVLTGEAEDIVAELGRVFEPWEHEAGHIDQAVAHRSRRV